MSKLKALFSITCLFLLLILLILPSPASAAEIEIFPGNGPVGSNTTEAGWTDNHLAGQSFSVPSGVVKVNRIRLTGFKLGHAGGNTGGIVSVALYAGEPTASTQVATSPEGQSSPFGYEGRTTVISPTGPMLAREERIFIGGELANDLASLCGVDQNSIEALFLRRMIINDPQRPCPRASEWTRAYQMLSDNQQGLRDEWSQWGVPYGSGVIFGESTFDWTPAPASYNTVQADQYYKGDVPSKYTGPNWTFDGGNLTVTIPNHQLQPGQHFLSIQQSHLDQNRGSEEGGYWEQGRYNCDRPNEPRQIDLYGTNTSGSQVRLDNPFCGKGNVFINGINTRNAYTSGRAYFNTFYYSPPGYPPTSGYNAATGDMANLQIYGEATYNPVGSLDGGTCAAITGWTCDGDNYNASLRVDFYADGPAGTGTGLGSATANLPRETAVANQCGGNPNHGFSFTIPANSLRDGRSHNIYAYGINIGSGTHTLLPGSPKSVTCTAPTPGTLQIKPDSATGSQEAGTYTISGLRSDSNQGGSNYYNAITIIPNVDNTNGSDIKLVGAAFTSQVSPPAPNNNTLSELMRSSNYNNNTNGFVLIYANKNTSYAGGPTPGTGSNQSGCNGYNFCFDTYYIYLKDGWHNFTRTIAHENQSIGITALARDRGVSLPSTPPQFSVTLYNALGNRRWGTYSYINWTGGERSIPREPVK